MILQSTLFGNIKRPQPSPDEFADIERIIEEYEERILTMYDSPKAIHFVAYLNGKRLPGHNPVGIEFRWNSAARLEHAGITDMLRMTSHKLASIRRILQGVNAGREMIVSLEGQSEEWARSNEDRPGRTQTEPDGESITEEE